MRTWKWMFTAPLLISLSAMAQQTTDHTAVIGPDAECCRLATRDHASADGSTRCFAARQQADDAIRARDHTKYGNGSAHDDG